MRKFFMTVAALLAATVTSFADEGMWLLPYLQKMNIADMQQKGLKLSAEDIYSANHSSLKDAVVIFGGGCTGEIVSPNGLLFTNHHCGFGSIQSLSSVGADYLKDGFWAMNNQEELPAPGLSVKFIREIVDVTPDIIANIPNIASEDERNKMVDKNVTELTKEYQKNHKNMLISIKPFFGGNQFFLFVMEEYNDVRLVGTPPQSIGKFGGETDNWMWPRHTGDFSIFRVYAGKDNKPASYSPENVPYKADEYLKISLNGYDEGDFAMIMGFPGSTQRYMTSFEIDQMLEIENPQRISIRGARQEILMEDMLASDKVRIQYASKYASSSNYWKNAIGMSRGLKKLDVKSTKQAEEAAFQKWAIQNTFPEERFIDALSLIESGVEESKLHEATVQYLYEAIFTPIEMTQVARAIKSKSKGRVSKSDKAEMIKMVKGIYKNYNEPTERKVAKKMLAMVKENAPVLPTVFAEVIDAEFGGDIDKYVDYLYDNSALATEQSAIEFINKFSKKKFEADPMTKLAMSTQEAISTALDASEEPLKRLAEGHRLYIKGLMQMQPDKAWASDANFTLRLTYGNVLPYSPADGVIYKYQTTLDGVIAKEDTSNPTEFTVEPRLKEIHAAKDYGQYADKDGNMPVAFLSNLDITGGNSGSPIMNDKGELLGLAFDGNWEAMSGDIAFEPELQRTISVDVRYVLMIIDKFAEASWLLDEMTIVGGDK